MEKRVKKVKRLNIKALIILLLIIYLIVMFLYTLFNMPIRNIYINNTKLLKDNDIILVAGLKKYPAWITLSKTKMENKIKTLELVSDVKVSKTLTGKVIINIEEAIPLFYNRNNDKVVLSNKLEVEPNKLYLGIPSLVNYVPKELLDEFKEAFSLVNKDIIGMINEIVYDPDIKDEVVIDDARFLLKMNDGNKVYVNVLNMKRLNNYIEIYASIKATLSDKTGTLYLDSYLSDNNLFTPDEEVSVGDKDGEN